MDVVLVAKSRVNDAREYLRLIEIEASRTAGDSRMRTYLTGFLSTARSAAQIAFIGEGKNHT